MRRRFSEGWVGGVVTGFRGFSIIISVVVNEDESFNLRGVAG
jgi:hypothetical protein